MKQTEVNTKFRPHAFIDFSKPEEAQLAQKDMFENDNFGLKRAQLGDKSCEILLAIRKRNKDFNTASSNNQAIQNINKLNQQSFPQKPMNDRAHFQPLLYNQIDL